MSRDKLSEDGRPGVFDQGDSQKTHADVGGHVSKQEGTRSYGSLRGQMGWYRFPSPLRPYVGCEARQERLLIHGRFAKVAHSESVSGIGSGGQFRFTLESITIQDRWPNIASQTHQAHPLLTAVR